LNRRPGIIGGMFNLSADLIGWIGTAVPRQKPTEVSMLKCYDSVTDGSVSRGSFHTACVDPTAPADARCRRNVVVRSFVFF
jgi:hypothetical protein